MSVDIMCEIVAAGPSLDGIRIRVKHNGDEKWYSAPSTLGKEMLATALAAITSGCNCLVRVANSAEYSEIEFFYLRAGSR